MYRILTFACLLFVTSVCSGQEGSTTTWLIGAQTKAGSWSSDQSLRVTALSLLCILENGRGSGLRSGPHRVQVDEAVTWLRQRQLDSGRFDPSDGHSWTDHAVAMLALCEVGRLSTSPSGSKHAVDAFKVLTTELERNPRIGTPVVLAIASLCCSSARRFDARMEQLVERYEGWRSVLESQPAWAAGAEGLEGVIAKLRPGLRPNTVRDHAAMLVLDALADSSPSPRLAAPLADLGLEKLARDPFAMLLFAFAAKHHLPNSSEAFENAWLTFAEATKLRLERSRWSEGDDSGSWDSAEFAPSLDRVELSAMYGLLLHELRDCVPLAPRYWTRSLQAAMANADKLVVRSGFRFPSEKAAPLLDLTDRKAVAALARSIRIDGNRSGSHCMCGGDPFLEFYAGHDLLVTVGFHHGRSLRWHGGLWVGDGLLEPRSSEQLIEWLAARGVDRPKREVEESRARNRQRILDRAKWLAAMPDSLRPFWECMRSGSVSGTRFGEMRLALEKAQGPDSTPQILELLEWFGSGCGRWSSYPSYEGVAERLLFEFETKQVIAAIESIDLTGTQLEGACRFFGGWSFSKHRAEDWNLLSVEWRKRFLEQGTRDGADDDRRSRARRAFERDP